jgi:hypothetical protein
MVDFVLRLCGPGDEKAVSLISQATILETYAGFAEGTDLHTYVSEELGVEKIRELLSSDRARIWALEAGVGKCMVGYAVAVSAEECEPFSMTELKRLYLFHRFHGLGLARPGDATCGFRARMSCSATWNGRGSLPKPCLRSDASSSKTRSICLNKRHRPKVAYSRSGRGVSEAQPTECQEFATGGLHPPYKI